ncbi:MAG: hypothetical protein QXH39_00775, partial [Conexivisphaerales archaeon]
IFNELLEETELEPPSLFFILFGSRRQMAGFEITWLSANRLCGEQNECPRAVISFCRIDIFIPRFELKNFDGTATPIYPTNFTPFLFEPVRTFSFHLW